MHADSSPQDSERRPEQKIDAAPPQPPQSTEQGHAVHSGTTALCTAAQLLVSNVHLLMNAPCTALHGGGVGWAMYPVWLRTLNPVSCTPMVLASVLLFRIEAV